MWGSSPVTLVWLDYALLGVILLSMLIGVLRGLVKEVMSLLGWVLAGWAALQFSTAFAMFLENFVSHDGLRYALAFISLFVGMLVLSMLVNHLVTKLVQLSGLKGIDRVLGSFFGALRGALIVVVLVLLGGISPMAAEPAWSDSIMVEYFEQVANWLSDNFAGHVAESVSGQQVDL